MYASTIYYQYNLHRVIRYSANYMKLFQDFIFKLIFILCYRKYDREFYYSSNNS